MTKQISREQYDTALNLVEEYHRQIIIDSKIVKTSHLTLITEWEKFYLLSQRTKNALSLHDYGFHVETIDKETFQRPRNLGQHCWNEFQQLRGY